MNTAEPNWRKSSLFLYMKELLDKDYAEMIEYEKAGGVLTEDDKIAKAHYEKYYKNRRKKSNIDNETEYIGEDQ